MKKKLSDQLSEKVIINSFLKKLNFNKKGTFNFENDAALIRCDKSVAFKLKSNTWNMIWYKNVMYKTADSAHIPII